MSRVENKLDLRPVEKRALLAELLRKKAAKTRKVPLSFAQQRLWFLDQLDPGSASYNISRAVRLKGELNLQALRQALNFIVARHESLRTNFTSVEGEPGQIIATSREVELQPLDLRGLPQGERESEARRLASEASRRGFNLAQDDLLRAGLFRLDDQDQVLLLVMHHIVSDGWSMGVLFRELSALYEAFSNSRPSPLPELPIQYGDFARWQREWLQGQALEEQVSYWKEQLAGAPAILELSTDRPRPAIQTFTGAYHTSVVRKELTESLNELSRREGVTLFMTLLAAFQTMLYRYANQEDIVVGTPIANRTRTETEGLIGFFVNTLVMRTDLSSDPSFRELLGRVREIALDAYAHQDLPFEKLVEELQPERSLGHMSLFQVLFALQNVPKSARKLAALDLTDFAFAKSTSKLDLSLYVGEPAEGLTLSFEYSTDLFDAATIERMAAHFQTLLEGIVVNPDQRIADLPLITAVERQRILVEWNDTEVEYPGDQLVQQVFERQVERSPDAVALVFDAQRLTYRELNGQANQLANYLNKVGVRPESRVGILLERSANMVVGMLAILKAGGAYVPLDPAYPEERLRFMIRDAGLNLVVSLDSLAEKLRQSDTRVLCLDSQQAEISRESEANLAPTIAAENLAYVIYTSGSTGEPKGVAVTHGTLVHLWASTRQQMGFKQSDVWTTVHSIAFDFSVWEIWISLLNGSRLVVVPREVTQSAPELYELLLREQVTVLNQTPAALRQLLEARREALQKQPDWSVRLIVCGGDALGNELAGELGQLRIPVWNFYGPTEGTVWATANLIDGAGTGPTLVTGSLLEAPPPEPQAQNEIYATLNSIGRSLPNIQVYLLNRRMQPVPVGVAGELFIGGANLARGYFKRPDLSAEKFVPDPFGTASGGRLYRTGDLARYRRNGTIEFIGRMDHQLKLRGFRIELGEIEVALTRHPDVSEAAVVIREDRPGDKRLVAYVVADEGRAPSPSELRVFLQLSQPDYMIPSSFVALDGLPLTPNKKVDRGALLAYDFSRTEEVESFVEPRTPAEEIVANIWAQVLGIERVGVNDNFFLLGGHSLLATQVIARIRGVFRVDVPLRVIFQHPTVAGLVSCFDESRKAGEFLPLTPVPRGATVPASFAQQRLWFLDQLDPGSASYNLSRALRMHGQLDVKVLRQALNAVVARHESLRTSFASVEGEPVQIISPLRKIELRVIDLKALLPEERETEARRQAAEASARPFNLAQDQLLRANLLQLDERDHVLLLVIHHIVSDGWSMSVLFHEIGVLYEAFMNKRPSPLPELPIQYPDFAVWQRAWLQGQVVQEQLDYWKKQLADAPTVLDLPSDRRRPAMQTSNGDYFVRLLPKHLQDSLNELSRQEGVTLFMTLLSAFQTMLHRYTRQEDFLLGTPIANRHRRETEDLIGFFVNTLVMRTDLSGNSSFRDLLRRTKEVALQAYTHQDLPFERLVEELQPERSLSHLPLFQALFAVQNLPHANLNLPALHLQEFSFERKATRFDLAVYIGESDNGLRATFEYNTDLFYASTIERMAEHFQTLLQGIVTNPNQRISELPLLLESERNQLLIEWNDTRAEFPRQQCIHRLFEEQVQRTPTSTALVFEDQELTYAELNHRANQLAHYLQQGGVGPAVTVGICVDRGVEMCLAVLGVLRAGGAYLPLDPAYPQERLSFMLQDAATKILLTNTRMRENLPTHDCDIISLDTEWKGIANESAENPASEAAGADVAYVIYTSGSTGRPKGVVMPHRALTNLLGWQLGERQGFGAARTLQFASLSFDVSFQEMFSTWCSGGTLVMVTQEMVRDAPAMLRFIADQGIERCFFPFVYLQHVAEVFQLGLVLPQRLREVITAGEQLEITPQIANFFKRLPECRLHNHYGPSESHVVTAYTLPRKVNEWGRLPPIGKPIHNTQIYIVDSNGEPVPVGVAGELCIGGRSLSRGYLNRAESTGEKFIPDRFSGERGGRLYRTGDLARYRADGEIEFLGRIDNQIKIRGFRVELGEIETTLVRHPQVREAVVVAREETKGERRLVAYVVTPGEEEGLGRELRKFLKQHLPEYMVPATFVQLEALPLTPSGKINRRALLVMKGEESGKAEQYAAPRTPAEEKLAEIWSAVLKRERIGIHDNFFDLGGHSMLAVKLMAEIEKAFGQKIPLVSLFQGSTIEYLTGLLRQDAASISWPTLIRIQAGDSKHPLFCVSHPNVNALGYRSLARYLGPDQPVYGLQAQYPEDLEGEHSRAVVEELATEYMQAMLAAQPNGPYQFVGMCRGAHIAYEIARRLENDGQKVALLGILDTWVLENTYSYYWYVEHYGRQLSSFLHIGLRNQLAFIRKKAQDRLGNSREAVGQVQTSRPRNINPLHETYFPGAKFVPPTYRGPIAVFRVRRQPLNRIRDRQLGWGRLTRGGVELHTVLGKHLTLLQEPYVRGLAEELKKCLLTESANEADNLGMHPDGRSAALVS
jgi:amino acid adenylation domain-containing protein